MIRVLVVDDDPDTAETLAAILLLKGISARHTSIAAEAVDLARDFRPDVAVLDLIMPDPDGIELAERLRETFPDVRVIAFTGHGRLVRASRSDLFFATFLKPVEPDTLMRAIERAVADRRPGPFSIPPPEGPAAPPPEHGGEA